jgi:hypothetical protein
MNAIRQVRIVVRLDDPAGPWSWQVVLADEARRIQLQGRAPTQQEAMDLAFQSARAQVPLADQVKAARS